VTFSLPFFARTKKGKYYLSVGSVGSREAVAVLSQIRFIDRKRLSNKICTIEADFFQTLTRAVIEASFTGEPLK
jgi:mRNA-degrading endonuclease toxin of MazEF toxin-antitoxin module